MSDSENFTPEEIDGAILSMHIRNFFCHDNLEVKFNKNINFIIGRNGSGKSAILTALTVGLGCRAAVTNRGSSSNSFIKKGTNVAHIEIKIKNSSPNAYRHEIYGDFINITRTLYTSGASSYKIKSESGTVVSTKYDDIAMICSVHDIQVDNPVCVLNQDDVRNFHASDAKKKYSLFRKATNMDMVEVNYKKALRNCILAKTILEKKKQAFSELEKELNQLKIRFDEMQPRDEVRASMRLLEDEYHWCEVAEFESNLKESTKSHIKQTAKVDNLIEQLNNLKTDQSNYNQKILNIKFELEKVAIESANKDADYTSMSAQLQEFRMNWKICIHELRRKKEQISRENSKVNDLAREVTEAMNINLAEERNSIMSKISEAKEKHSEVLARKGTVGHELIQTRNAISHEESSLNNAAKKKDSLQSSSRHVKAQLNELNVRGKDEIAVYGKNMTDLVAALKTAHSKGQFSEMPRGPVGSFLKVRDKKWTSALEHIIGGSLKTFCVNSQEDSRKLFSIMQNVYGGERKPTITTSRFYNKVHDVSRKCVRAPPGMSSSLDCLQVNDSVVANFLIDNIGMESILLVPTHDQAISFATDESRVPQNCSKIVTLDQTEFYPSPNYRSYGGAGRPSRYLQVSTNERKKQLQMELQNHESELAKADAEFWILKAQSSKLSVLGGELDDQLQRLLKAQNMLEGKLSTLEANLRDMEGGHIKVLTLELNQAREKLTKLQEEETILIDKEEDLKVTTKSLELKVTQLRQEKDALHMTLDNDLNQEQLKLERNISEISMTSQAINDEKLKLKEFHDKVEKQKALVQEKNQKAEQLCPRIESPRQMSVIITELKKVKAKFDSMNRDGPSKQQVADRFIEKTNLHKSTSRIITLITLLIEKLEKAATYHLNSAMQIQALIANRVQYCFQVILKVRGYLGSIEINHEKSILEIKCTGRDSATVRAASSTRSLSGGERSYATVAFIMALWECMELPFYFLDEFDVFMDNVNRKTTMELLIGHAQANPNRQYVFLTPQDTSILVPSQEITIHRLADPVRDQA